LFWEDNACETSESYSLRQLHHSSGCEYLSFFGFCANQVIGKPRRILHRQVSILVLFFSILIPLNVVQAQELIPIHPVYGVQDWDAAPGAIDWPLLISFLIHVKATGHIPPDHRSHDHLNKQTVVPVDKSLEDKWKAVFEEFEIQRRKKGEKIVWGLVDGFLLYWHPVRAGLLLSSFFNANYISRLGSAGSTRRSNIFACASRRSEAKTTRTTRVSYSR